MRILFINQFFWPDSSATSQLLTDLACGMVERGHEVHVICTDGGYAQTELGAPPPIHVVRVKALPFVRGKIGRLLSYLSFYLLASLRSLALPKPDLVVSLTTPPLISLIGTLLKSVSGARHIIWEMDMYPDVATDLDYFRGGGLIDRVTGAIADFSRQRADIILALGECMKGRLIQRGVSSARIRVTENWADANSIRPRPRSGSADEIVLLYSGNLGMAHDLDTVCGAMLALRNDPRFRFLFVGGGARRQELASFVEQEKIHSVEFRSYAPLASLGESLSLGDIGLVTQRDVCCGSVVPSKVYGILAAGRPVLFIGPRAATPALTVARFQCGWQIDCGDVEALTGLLLHLAQNPQEIHAAGQRARQALLGNFDRAIGVQRIAAILESPTMSASAPEQEPSAGKTTIATINAAPRSPLA